jgi:hypothetical protein
LSKRELEKEIAREFPETRVVERTKYISESRLEMKLSVSEKLHEKLKRIQDLVSGQAGQAASWEKVLEAMADLYLEKRDPIEKAKRAEAREKSKVDEAREDGGAASREPAPGQVQKERQVPADASKNEVGTSQKLSPIKIHSRYIPAKIAHQVRLRDGGRCTARTRSGQRCPERRWLDIHHIQPVSRGGLASVENLTLLCRGHHQLLHERAS